MATAPANTCRSAIEVFDRTNPAEADAEVFALFASLLADHPVRPVTGDIGILMAAVRGLDTTPRRKAALLRHIWRPARFRQLLDRFSGRAPMPEARAAQLQRLATGTPLDLIAAAGPLIGLRAAEDIADRVAALIEDAATKPIAAPEAALLYDLLGLQAPAEAALAHLKGITSLLPAIEPAVANFAARLTALKSRGIDTARLAFEASLGRTSMEYYDGFTFSFLSGDLPPVASGGRYDALDRRAGAGAVDPGGGRGDPPRASGARMIKIGIPSKGRLMTDTFDWFSARGLAMQKSGSEREYSGHVAADGVELVLLSAGEIPRELAAGRIDLGVTGSDLVRDKLADWQMQVSEVASLGFGHADLIIAVPAAWIDVDTLDDLDAAAAAFRAAHGHRLRIATKYHRLVRDFLTAAWGRRLPACRQPGRHRSDGQEPDRRSHRRHHLVGRNPARQPPEGAVRQPDPAIAGHAVSLGPIQKPRG